MTRSTRRIRIVKVLVISVLATVAILGLMKATPYGVKVSASASGPTPSHTNAPGESNCTECHADFAVNSGTGNVMISGVPANYLPNQQISVTVRTNQADAVVFGFQLTAVDSRGNKVGTYTIPTQNPVRMQLVDGLVNNIQRQYIEHTVDGIIPSQFGFNTWTFTWTAPSTRVGKVGFYAAGNAANSDGGTSGDYIYTKSAATLSGSAISSFDADGSSDIAVYRPSSGVWYSLNSSDGGFQAVQFGIAEDKVVAGDYDGDGKTDRAVWRPSSGVWFIQKSSGGVSIAQFGATGDVPVPGDYDGDLKTDLAVWRPSTGVWYVARSSNGSYDIRQFGVSTDKAMQADFDGDAKTDLAVYRPSTGVWYVWRSSDGGFTIQGFGLDGDLPVAGDYDGDGKADLAVFRPSSSVWYANRSTLGFSAIQFGISTDKPTPADFDGDGKIDIAVFRNGVWYILRSTDGGATIASFGLAGDVPIPTGYISQ
ncbi:MAG: hypothetical protein DMF63_06055 [Acidobacteria bacterium]|nr:MAG: hypothetical protein DMF63_06055 [Acidobacteriota bacterium]